MLTTSSKEGDMKDLSEILPSMIFLTLLTVNFISSLTNGNRNSWASFIATSILLGLTYWGGFYKPLIDFLAAKV
jgi:hypothetical protein